MKANIYILLLLLLYPFFSLGQNNNVFSIINIDSTKTYFFIRADNLDCSKKFVILFPKNNANRKILHGVISGDLVSSVVSEINLETKSCANVQPVEFEGRRLWNKFSNFVLCFAETIKYTRSNLFKE